MKKNYSFLAIVAIALTSVFCFTSCDKKDEPATEQKPVMLPIESIEGRLVYDYSESALELFDIKYEVTDFNGKKETFTVTKPGEVELIYKASNIRDVAKVKQIVTAKDVKAVGNEEKFSFKFQTYVDLPTKVGGLTIYPVLSLDVHHSVFSDSYVYYDGNFDISMEGDFKQDAIKEIQNLLLTLANHEGKFALPSELYNGVSEDYVKEHTKK